MTVPEQFPNTVAFDQVFCRFCRVCVLNFGSPEDVQRFVSSGIAIFQLRRKVPELKQILLHSKPNAKINSTKCRTFIADGCYKTSEILFAAATVHQVAILLCFKDLGLT